jgi:drug/metabolite transporter (DMT)-like permease
MYRVAFLAVMLAAVFWGIDGIVLRPALFSLPVALVVFVESSIVAVLLTPLMLRRVSWLKELQAKDWLAFLGLALLGGAVGTMAITKALFYVNFINLSIVVLIQKLQPVFAIFLAAVLLHERPRKRFILYAAAAVSGAYLMTFGWHLPVLQGKITAAATYALVATFSFSASTILSKRALRNAEFKQATYLRFALTAIIMLVIILSSGQVVQISEISGKQWLIFLLIAFTTGGPAIFLYYFGLRHIKASRATIAELAFPLTAMILEYFIRGNLLHGEQWLGVILLLVSITLIAREQS